MDIGNDVDLSNKNITPLWKRRTDNSRNPQDSSKPKPRPVSYHINGVMTTDLPVEDNRSSFTLSQPAERLVVTPPSWGQNTVVLKHVLHKPSRKSRVVRSISIGHFSNGLFSLAKFRSEDSRSASLDNRVRNGDSDRGKTSNGGTVWPEKHLQDPQNHLSSPFNLSSQKDQIAFGTNSLSPESAPLNRCSPVPSPHTPNNNNYNHNELSSLSSASSPSPPTRRTPTPSHSSTSSIPSLSSLTSSDPPTPRSPSPADRGQALLRQSSSSPASSQDTRNASSFSSISSTSPSPSLSPSISPSPSIVLSTHSPAALKMGTQQLIPKGLVCDTRQNKMPSSGPQGHGLAGLLGLDHSRRALKALSMVETGTYFSTGGGLTEATDGESESPGTLRRGLRSTSYRRAVVSGVDLEVPSVDPKAQPLSLPITKGQDGNKPASPASPASPGSVSLTSPGTAKPASTGTPKPASPGTPKPASPGTPKPASPRISKPTSPGTEKQSSTGKIKSPDRKKVLTSQRTFDSEEEELYQNYQEKALHNDSDEDADSREPKPDNGIVVQYRPIRTSWSQLSVLLHGCGSVSVNMFDQMVKKSGLSERMSQEERKRQEAIFEVISSEHSYLHSLEILIRMFKNSAELSDAMTKTEHHHLFSNITDVCEASKKFFKELEERHQQNIVIDDISDIVCKHAQSNFDPYVTYCSNEVYQQRTLQKLVSKNPAFKEVLTRIEGHPDCRNLPMISFLILPMQRITRLPLLMDTICQKTPKDSAQYEECTKALQGVSKVVRKCNEGARTMERTEMMYTINSQLEFKIKPFPLVSSSRWMVKRGELTAFVEDNGIFLKRMSRQQVYFFLFNDVFIVTRKKSEESYAVIDYALRDQIWVGPCQPEDLNLSPVRSTASMLSSRQAGANHLFRLRFRSNHSGEKVPMILGTELLNERARWISALGQNVNNKKSQDRSNAMQVEVIRTYTAKQPDELSLQVADVVLVSQTVEDGWYEGDRLRDGERGWFLAECAQPITCQATIERNMQRMDRLQGLETNV
ncbi:Rho guanine nucleotide exchange factor 26 SH3 domain-containing guanine exchange factor [Collichthys lucidus]|uniref:Rho guanine nucleotide exchange factor 26 SH3 domain-containing guanine exchange factor n=1 Tax=Collichthys lucidus TaxID=240159 RepID=A0A4U5V086_COLLU|nr:Rho guanine nucleotide exchange factor 26 SH3 domain-containing guanine exchange factor [Collichthys lucidus]